MVQDMLRPRTGAPADRTDSPVATTLPRQSSASPIFIIGSGRSGTTLLRVMLSAHPRIYLTHEAFFYEWDDKVPPTAPGDEFVERYLNSFNFRWLKLDVETFLPQVPRGLPRDRMHVLFEAVMRAKARQHGKVRFGDKSPSHSGYLARIFEDFPEARVVRIIRDPRAVAHSLTRMPWFSSTAVLAAGINELERRRTAPFRDRILQIRLEDLLADPRRIMGEVLEFVGEPWDDRVLDHTTYGPGPGDLPPFPWFSAAAERRSTSTVDAWTTWPPETIRLVERISRGSMEDGHYAPAKLESEPSALAVAWAMQREAPRSTRDALTMYRLVRLAVAPGSLFDSAEYQKLFRCLNPDAWKKLPGFEMPATPALRADWKQFWGVASRADAHSVVER